MVLSRAVIFSQQEQEQLIAHQVAALHQYTFEGVARPVAQLRISFLQNFRHFIHQNLQLGAAGFVGLDALQGLLMIGRVGGILRQGHDPAAGEARGEISRLQHGNMDAEGPDLAVQGLRVALHGELGSAVRALIGQARQATQGTETS